MWGEPTLKNAERDNEAILFHSMTRIVMLCNANTVPVCHSGHYPLLRVPSKAELTIDLGSREEAAKQ